MLQAYKVPQFDKRLAKEIEFRGGEGTIDQTSYVAPEALRRMMKRSVTVTAPPIGERSIVMTVSVCLSVCLSVWSRSYLRKYTSDLQHLCACYPWAWLGPHPSA